MHLDQHQLKYNGGGGHPKYTPSPARPERRWERWNRGRLSMTANCRWRRTWWTPSPPGNQPGTLWTRWLLKQTTHCEHAGCWNRQQTVNMLVTETDNTVMMLVAETDNTLWTYWLLKQTTLREHIGCWNRQHTVKTLVAETDNTLWRCWLLKQTTHCKHTSH